jgi:hypothetical protein
MKRIVKFAAAAVVVTGALMAFTAANAGYFGPDYPDQSGAGYGPALLPPQAYQAYAFAPGPRQAYRGGTCWISTFDSTGYGYSGSCASNNVDLDADTLGQARPNKTFVRP